MCCTFNLMYDYTALTCVGFCFKSTLSKKVYQNLSILCCFSNHCICFKWSGKFNASKNSFNPSHGKSFHGIYNWFKLYPLMMPKQSYQYTPPVMRGFMGMCCAWFHSGSVPSKAYKMYSTQRQNIVWSSERTLNMNMKKIKYENLQVFLRATLKHWFWSRCHH